MEMIGIRKLAWTAVPGAALAISVVALGAGSALAQTYPSKPVRIVLPFPGGSSTDVMMRVLGERLQERLGQPIVIDPRPGAGAVVATNYVKSQPADGYTLMASTSSQTITTAGPNPPYDARSDLTHIIRTVGGPIFIAVNTQKLPNVRTLREFIDHARANPGQVNFGSYGAGSLGHLAVELFNQSAKVRTLHIPYKGSPANMVALANGDSHAALDVMTFMQPHIASGKVRVLAATTVERSPMVPDYPGMREAGLPDYEVSFWQGIAGPAGLPRDVVGRLNSTINAALKDPQMVEYSKKAQNILIGGSAEEITGIVNREVATWARVIKEANIVLQ